MKIKSLLVIAVLATVFLGFGFSAQAQTDVSAMIAQLQAQIASLMEQIQALQSQQGTTPAWCHTFNTSLGIGSTGDEVQALQETLKKEVSFDLADAYSDGGGAMNPSYAVTFGENTASAVVKLQQKYGITPLSGYVGVKTRAKLNSLYGCGTTANITNGICGLASNVTSSTTPTSSLCSSGTARSTPYTNFSTPVLNEGQWTWYCVGANGGVTASCEAPYSSSTQPSITVTSPNGGETFVQGQTYNITWNSANIPSNGNIYISLVNDATGKQYGLTTTIGNSGTYSWAIPTTTINYDSILGSQFKIQVQYSPSTTIYSAKSANHFSIVSSTAQPSVGVTANGDNGMAINTTSGTPVTIGWTSTNANNGCSISSTPTDLSMTGQTNKLPANSSMVVTPIVNTTYTVTCYNVNSNYQTTQASDSMAVSVTNLVPAVNVTANGDSGMAINVTSGTPVTIGWTSTNANNGCSISSTPVDSSMAVQTNKLPANSSMTVRPTRNTNYTVTCYNVNSSYQTTQASDSINVVVP